MNKLATFVVIALLANLATVAVLPRLINSYVMHEVVKISGGYNVARAWPRPDAESRGVVRPSPDLLYTTCAFDVSEHPLRITAPVPDSYLSVSGFAANTDNFFAVNDAQVRPGADGLRQLDVVLAKAGANGLPEGVRVIVPPTNRGLILFRTLITRDAALTRLKDAQSRQACRPL